jgi:hypothetical protein
MVDFGFHSSFMVYVDTKNQSCWNLALGTICGNVCYKCLSPNVLSANRHVPLTTDSALQDNILNNTTTNSIIHTHIMIHVLTILSI